MLKMRNLQGGKIISVTEVVTKTAILGGVAIEVDQQGSLRLKEAWRKDRANKWLRTRTSVLKTSSENFPVNTN